MRKLKASLKKYMENYKKKIDEIKSNKLTMKKIQFKFLKLN